MHSNKMPATLEIAMVNTPEGHKPKVESTEMGAATQLRMLIEGKRTLTLIGVASKNSMRKGKPRLKGFITRQPKRLVVGMHGEEPLLRYDFDSGSDMFFRGRPVHTIWIYGGIELTKQTACFVHPIIKVSFNDSDASEELKLDYIKLECWPPTEANQKSPIWPPKELMCGESAQTEEVISPIL